jgi:hypothetical protein
MRILAIVLTLMLVCAAVVTAGTNPNVKAVVHVQAYNAKASCATVPVFTSCEDFVTVLGDASIHALPVFFDAAGITGAEYALTWPGGYSAGWTDCADFAIGGIAFSGDSISQTWSTCQMGWAVVCGLAWIYPGAGYICMVPHGESGFIGVTDCDFQPDVPVGIFCAGVGGETGDDPCTPTATEPTTWGGIKSMFR